MAKELFFGVFWYFGDLVKYKRMSSKAGINNAMRLFPEVFDKNPASHTFDKHYVYMDRWAFKKLMEKHPSEHIDVGSSIRFLSMATAVIRVKFVDIRPISLDFENFECVAGDILKLPFADSSVESISCLHVAEHVGLGRYGDPLDVNGTLKACRELARVLKPGGRLFFALPVGRTATYFNAFRVHSPELVLEYFKDLKLLEFAAVSDQGRFIPNAKLDDYKNALYACGMFEFTKNF
jgi:SAM-dependent methyltransferase